MLPPVTSTGFLEKVVDPDKDELLGKANFKGPIDEVNQVRYINDQFKDKKKKMIIVLYFVGGVTYSEICAANYLTKKYPDKYFIVATTQTLNQKKVVEAMKEVGDNI
jgi:hypothetical protein